MIKYLRWRNWAVFEYNSMTENVFLFFYCAIKYNSGGWSFVLSFLLFYLFSAISTSYGYLVNDLSDRELDKKHNKPNVFNCVSSVNANLVVFLFASGSIALSSRFFSSPYFMPLYSLWFIFTTFYSLPPLRLKERGLGGLIVVVAAQRVIPAVLAISVFGRFTGYDWIILVLYASIRGFMSDIRHQIQDFHNDSSTNTHTFVISSGLSKGQKILRYFLLMNLLLQVVIYSLSFRLMLSSYIKITIMSIFVSLYFFMLCIYLDKYREKMFSIDPYNDNGICNFVHISFATFYFPILLMVIHSMKFPQTILLIILFLIIKKVYTIKKMTSSLPYRLIQRVFEKVNLSR